MVAICHDARNWYLKNIRVMNRMTNTTNKHGLGFMQYCILAIVSNSAFETPAHLAEELEMADSSISRALKRMYTMNLIERRTSEFDDTRKIKLKITHHGKNLVEKINRELDEEFPKYFNN